MGRKKTGSIPTEIPNRKKKMVIDMTKISLAKAYQNPGFRTGKHMTEKDRTRKKNWKKEYEKQPGSLNNEDSTRLFLFYDYREKFGYNAGLTNSTIRRLKCVHTDVILITCGA